MKQKAKNNCKQNNIQKRPATRASKKTIVFESLPISHTRLRCQKLFNKVTCNPIMPLYQNQKTHDNPDHRPVDCILVHQLDDTKISGTKTDVPTTEDAEYANRAKTENVEPLNNSFEVKIVIPVIHQQSKSGEKPQENSNILKEIGMDLEDNLDETIVDPLEFSENKLDGILKQNKLFQYEHQRIIYNANPEDIKISIQGGWKVTRVKGEVLLIEYP